VGDPDLAAAVPHPALDLEQVGEVRTDLQPQVERDRPRPGVVHDDLLAEPVAHEPQASNAERAGRQARQVGVGQEERGRVVVDRS